MGFCLLSAVGKHSRVRFWHDNWLGIPLVGLLPDPESSDLLVSSFLNLDGSWNLLDCFSVVFLHVTELILDAKVDMLASDVLLWKYSSNVVLSSKTIYLHLIGQDAHTVGSSANFLWNSSHLVLTWQLLKGQFALDEVLTRRGFALALRCHLCKVHVESFSHLFICCAYASSMWD